MANSNQIELVVSVEVDKANKSIKSVNASMSGMEQAAVRAGRNASQGIDGMTAAMVKGATAGSLLADGIKKVLGWMKDLVVETAKYAARTDVLAMVSQQMAKVNGVSAESVDLLVNRIKALGITTQEAHGVIQRMMFAQLDLAKAAQLARVAQNAAVIAGVDSSEALENIILGITTGQTRLLHNMGLQVSLLNVEAQASKELGHQLSDQEKRAAMLNAVLKEGAKIDGTYEAAMEKVGKQMTSLRRYFAEAKNAIGQAFRPEMEKVVYGLKDLAYWLQNNAAAVASFAKGIAAVVAVGGITMLAMKVTALTAALGDLSAALLANPIGLVVGGVVAASGILYMQYQKLQQAGAGLDAQFQKWITTQIKGAKTGQDLTIATQNVKKAFESGALEAKGYAQALQMIDDAKARIYGWDMKNYAASMGLKIHVDDPKAAAAAAAALAEQVGKAQLENEKVFRNRAIDAGKVGLSGFAKDVADVNAEIAKRTVLTDNNGQTHRFALTKAAWASILSELQQKWTAFEEKVATENAKQIADWVKGQQAAHEKVMAMDAEQYQKRLQYEGELAQKNMDHVEDLYRVQEARAGYERDAALRQVEATDAQTLQQKAAVEQRKADIEISYLQKVQEIKDKLFDIDTQRQAIEEEANMKRLGYQADQVKARIDELQSQRAEIKRAGQEETGAAIQAARENAAIRTAQMVRDQNQRIFESLKQQAGGVFDALLQKSQSVWSVIANSFKTAVLTAIKEVVTSRVAAALMMLLGGGRASYAAGGAGGSGGGILGGILGGGLLGGGNGGVALGGGVFGSGPVNGNPMILSAVGGTGAGGSGGGGGILGMLGLKGGGGIAGLKDFLGFGGGVQYAPGQATTWAASTMGQKLSALGRSNAALLGGGILAMDGLRRGGFLGLGETTAGGAMIGFKYGGPLGAAIGGAIGAAAGIARLFIKGATEKARQKIKATYGIDIPDKGILQQIVDISKQAFGGNLDVAIHSQQVRDLVQLYAMSTGQSTKGMPATMQSLTMQQAGGSLYSMPNYQNGVAQGTMMALDSIGRGTASGAGGTLVVPVQIDSKNVATVVVQNGRLMTQGVVNGVKANAGRRQLTSLQLSPGLITA